MNGLLFVKLKRTGRWFLFWSSATLSTFSGCVVRSADHYHETGLVPSEVGTVHNERQTSLAGVSGVHPFALGGKNKIYHSLPGGRDKILWYDLDAQKSKGFLNLSEWFSDTQTKAPRVASIKIDELERIVVAENGTGKLLRISPDAKKLEVLADSYDGYRFSSIAKVELGAEGDCFLSSPATGVIYNVNLDSGHVSILNDRQIFAENLLFQSSQKRLLVSEPTASRVLSFDLADSSLPKTADTLVDFSPAEIRPHGMALDEQDLLYLSLGSLGEIRIYDLRTAAELKTIKVNHFAGDISFQEGSLLVGGAKSVSKIKL